MKKFQTKVDYKAVPLSQLSPLRVGISSVMDEKYLSIPVALKNFDELRLFTTGKNTLCS